MPSLTTGELVSILIDNNIHRILSLKDPSECVRRIRELVNKYKILPAGQTLDAVFDATVEISSREFGSKRSSKWPKVRKDYLKLNPECAACGGKTSLNVHHILPYHIRPDLELEPSNLLTLCEKSDRYGWRCPLSGESKVGHNWAMCH